MFPHLEQKKIQEGFRYIIGCDEVGRGSLAGPVVAAAIVLKNVNRQPWFHQVRDSKLLLPAVRERLAVTIQECSYWGVGAADEKIIDEINIHRATLLAMRRAVENLLQNKNAAQPYGLPQEYQQEYFLYIDGKFIIPGFDMQQAAVVKGDNKILSVAAASIVAKVYRDNLMRELHHTYPVYNFAQHKGYATFHHRQMIMQNGISPIHRKSFCKAFIV